MTDRPISDDELLDVAKYALKTADESVSEQYLEVQSIRLRASFLITANALTSTLFATLLSDDYNIDFYIAMAVVSFVVCNYFCIYLMLPKGSWRIGKYGKLIVEDYIDLNDRVHPTVSFSILAIKADEDQMKNETIVEAAHDAFFYAMIFFVVSSIFWLVYFGLVHEVIKSMRIQ